MNINSSDVGSIIVKPFKEHLDLYQYKYESLAWLLQHQKLT